MKRPFQNWVFFKRNPIVLLKRCHAHMITLWYYTICQIYVRADKYVFLLFNRTIINIIMLFVVNFNVIRFNVM